MLNELLNAILSADTSNLSGAVTKIPSVKFPPRTLKLCESEAVAVKVENVVGVPVVAMVGVVNGVPEAETLSIASPEELPLSLPRQSAHRTWTTD
jgi:hypothetical protein